MMKILLPVALAAVLMVPTRGMQESNAEDVTGSLPIGWRDRGGDLGQEYFGLTKFGWDQYLKSDLVKGFNGHPALQQTILHTVASSGRKDSYKRCQEILKIAVSSGAVDLNQRDCFNMTALDWAIHRANKKDAISTKRNYNASLVERELRKVGALANINPQKTYTDGKDRPEPAAKEEVALWLDSKIEVELRDVQAKKATVEDPKVVYSQHDEKGRLLYLSKHLMAAINLAYRGCFTRLPHVVQVFIFIHLNQKFQESEFEIEADADTASWNMKLMEKLVAILKDGFHEDVVKETPKLMKESGQGDFTW